jgi:hypothetical protein
MVDSDTFLSLHHPWVKSLVSIHFHEYSKFRINQSKSRLWKWNSLVSVVKIVLSVMDVPMKICGWSVVLYRNNEWTCKSPSILSLQIFATGPTFLTFNQTHYERNDLIGWITFEVCNAKTYELFMSTNVYKRFDPRVMGERETYRNQPWATDDAVPLAWIKSMQVKLYAFFNIYLN